MKLLSRFASIISRTTPLPTAASDIDGLDAAIDLLDRGKPAKALEMIERLLPDHRQDGRTHFFHGNALLANGRPHEALEAYQQALSIKPDSAGAYFNLGNAYGALKMHQEQLDAYVTATNLKDNFFDAELALADLLERIKQPEEALARFKNVIDIDPDSLLALTRYGQLLINLNRNARSENLCKEAIRKLDIHLQKNPLDNDSRLLLGHLHLDIDPSSEDALQAYSMVIKNNPEHVEALNNLGAIWKNRGDFQRSYSYYKTALTFHPDSHEILNNMGTLLMTLGQLDESTAYLNKAIAVKPDFAEGHCNLGLVHFKNTKYDEAIASFTTALGLNPELYLAANNLGSSLLKIGQTEQARLALLRAIEISPDIDDAYSNLAGVYLDQGDHTQAAELYRKAVELNPKATIAFSNLLFCHNYTRELSKNVLYEEALAYGRMVRELATPFTDWPISTDPERKLRIGLLSADFYSHPVGYFLESIVAAFNTSFDSKFELVAFYNNWICDDVTHAIQENCSEWHLIFHLNDQQAAQLIHNNKIDILIDLSGHTGSNRLPVLAWRPAPVQVNWLGYFATTGVSEIEYLIADPYALPASEERYFSEKIWRLPNTRLCFSPPSLDISVNESPALKQGYITFGCFNALPKMTDEVVKVWAKILNQIPDSKLVLKARQLGETPVQEIVYERFARHGIERKQLTLLPPSDRKSYLETYHDIDIALDPFPYTGGTTTVEALWMGVPVLTLAGDSLLGRQGVGMLSNVGIGDWIAEDLEDYVDRAIAHSQNLQKLNTLRIGLREQLIASPLCDAKIFSTHLANALRQMWHTYCIKGSHLQQE